MRNNARDVVLIIAVLFFSIPVFPSYSENLRQNKYVECSEKATKEWQRGLRKKFAELLKMDDLLKGKDEIPFNCRIVSSKDTGDYISQEIEINSTVSRKILITVTIPSKISTVPLPAVVCIAGHGSGLYEVYQKFSIYNGFADRLASSGYITVSVSVSRHDVYENGRTLIGERLWDIMRCVDYLETLPNVNRKRIGCAGLSLGGEMAMWLGAMDERISAVVSAGFLTKMDQLESNHCLCWKFPGLREAVDFSDIYSMTAPRFLMCQNGLREEPSQFPPDIASKAMEEIQAVYSAFGKSDNAILLIHESGHAVDVPSLVFFFNSRL